MANRTKAERLGLILARLGAAPATASEAEAMRQLAGIINAVEDEFSGVPYNPPAWETDGRMYPPMKDRRRPVQGYPDVARYRARKHNVYVSRTGAIEIHLVDGTVAVRRAGTDNRGVWDR